MCKNYVPSQDRERKYYKEVSRKSQKVVEERPGDSVFQTPKKVYRNGGDTWYP